MDEMIKQEAQEERSTLDLLLSAKVPNLAEKRERALYEVKRVSELTGAPAIFELEALPYGRVQELKRLSNDVEVQILLAGCVSPGLKSEALRKKFGGVTPADTVKNMLSSGEIADLSQAVERLCGYRQMTIKQVKNA